MNQVLVVMLAAQGGRHILVQKQQGVATARQVYTFKQSILGWDAVLLHIVTGVQECIRQGAQPDALALCTEERGAVLLDAQDKILWCTDAPAPQEALDTVHRLVSPQALYSAGAMQCCAENALYSLAALRLQNSAVLDNAAAFLTAVDYLNYRLTGVLQQEYTCAAATALVNAARKGWDTDLLCALELPEKLFFDSLSAPGRELGPLLPQFAQQTGFKAAVYLAPHAATAVCSVLPQDTAAFLHTKTQTLLGMRAKLLAPNAKSYKDGFSYLGIGDDYFCTAAMEPDAPAQMATECMHRLARLTGNEPAAVYAPNAREAQCGMLTSLGLPVLTQPKQAAATATALRIMLSECNNDALCEAFWRLKPQG